MQGKYLEVREAHYAKYFGPIKKPVMHSTDVKPVHIDIYQFPPRGDRRHWTLITGGMSDRAQYVPRNAPKYISRRAEIMMYVRRPAGWMFSVLKGLAEMPFVDKTFLHWFHTVPNGMPMTPKPSLLTSFFFLPPYFEPEGFDSLKVGRNKVDILLLIPITEAERKYAIKRGSAALKRLMAKKNLDPVVNERRKSLV